MSDFERQFGATPKEIERKFLVDPMRLPVLDELPYKDIRQGYLAIEPSGSEVRIRDKSGAYTIAKKAGKGLVRDEIERPITKELFDDLWHGIEGREVEKRRYTIPHSGRIIELDIFSKPLGLILAEVEFGSVEQANDFDVPDWFTTDVTSDPLYKNQNLALQVQEQALGPVEDRFQMYIEL